MSLVPKTVDDIIQELIDQCPGLNQTMARQLAESFMGQSKQFHQWIADIDDAHFPKVSTHYDLDQMALGHGIKRQPSGCNHDMKDYQGFKESYRYCTKCDHKE